MKKIPVILASDNNYAPFMCITMLSILENANSDSFIDFYLLVPEKFSEEHKKQIADDCKNYKNCTLNFINLQNAFSSLEMTISHITQESYYRLMADKILPETYDKCIYLDVDLIAVSDLSEFFNTDIGDNIIAGVKAASYHYQPNEKLCKLLQIDSIDQYINAGSIIMNLKAIREQNLGEIMCKAAEQKYPSQDQDVLNKVCYNKIKLLPLRYNLMTKYESLHNKNLPEFKMISGVYGVEQIEDALRNPVIIHYAGPEKPWDSHNIILSEIWWKYAKKSSYYQDIVIASYDKKFKKLEHELSKQISDINLLLMLNILKRKRFFYRILSVISFGKYHKKITNKLKHLNESISREHLIYRKFA